MNRDLSALLREALICSVFADPADPGLSRDELFEIGNRAGFQDGEIGDSFQSVTMNYNDRDRLLPDAHILQALEIFERIEPSLLNRRAADVVIIALNDRIKADGIQYARLDRGVAIQRAVDAGHGRHAVEGAVTCLVVGDRLRLKGDDLVPRISHGLIPLLNEQSQRPARFSEARAKALPHVRDVVARRSDGRPRQAEALSAFPDALERIGLRHFRMWWAQTVAELRGSDPTSAPVSCVVLSAALVEGALTFAAKHAREKRTGAFQSDVFDKPMRSWNAGKLIESAAAGGAMAILSPPLKARAEHLNQTRQRVHAGRMLEDFPGGPPDLRPEEGRDAKATAEQAVRAVLDWLDKVSPEAK